MTSAATLVVGCSEQRPNELRAYHLMGTASDGAILLSRHGATYSAAASEISDYPALLERMLGVVLLSGAPPGASPPRSDSPLEPGLGRRGSEPDASGPAAKRQRVGVRDRAARKFHLAIRAIAAHA